MPQGNLGYKSGKGKFAIHDILRELKYPPKQKRDIDLSDFTDPYPALEFIITMVIGCCQQVPEDKSWEMKLSQFIRELHRNGWTTRKINGMVLSIMNKKSLGVEVYRCMGGAYIR